MDPIVREALEEHLQNARRNLAMREGWLANAKADVEQASDAVLKGQACVLAFEFALGDQAADSAQAVKACDELADRRMAAREALVDNEKAEMAIDQAVFADAVR